MSIQTWGDLLKSQVDDETIEQAIARLIQAHDDDEAAHLETGQSLQSHKASDIIDHLASSIIADKVLNGELTLNKLSSTEHQIITSFESLDGWAKSSTGISVALGGIAIQTGTTINTVKTMSANPYGDDNALNWSKNSYFQTAIALSAITNQTIYFIMGSCELDGTDNAFGFKISNGTLYAIHIVGDGNTQTEYTTEISGITLTDFNIYRAEFDADSDVFSFYVNGNLETTQSTNIPTVNKSVLFSFYIKNTEASNKSIYSKYLFLSQGL